MNIKIISVDEIPKINRKTKVGFNVFIEKVNLLLEDLGYFACTSPLHKWDGEKWQVCGEPTIYLHKVPEERIEYILNHETLHTVLNKLDCETRIDYEGKAVRPGLDELIDFIVGRVHLMNYATNNGKPFPYTRTDKFIVHFLNTMEFTITKKGAITIREGVL